MTVIAHTQTSEDRDPRTFAIIEAAMEVHHQLGYGFFKPVYQEALALEFATRDVPFRREVELLLSYKGKQLNTTYRADFVCFDSVIVEHTALAKLSGNEEVQIINDLKSIGFGTGLLLNFGARSLEWRRFIFSGTQVMPSFQDLLNLPNLRIERRP
jgi:GxxExxY protein